MPYTGLNEYTPLENYKGASIKTDILQSYENHINPFKGTITEFSSSTAYATVTDPRYSELIKGMRFIIDYSIFDYDDGVGTHKLAIIGPEGQTSSRYPILNLAWENDEFPLHYKTILRVTFNGEAFECEDSLIGIANQEFEYYEHDINFKMGFEGTSGGYSDKIKYITDTGFVYMYDPIFINDSLYHCYCSNSWGRKIPIQNFSTDDFYGLVLDVAYIQEKTYIVRNEWNEDDGSNASVTLWESTDGINFTYKSTIFSNSTWVWGRLRYNGTYWLFGSSSDNILYYSTDGINWTEKSLPATNYNYLSVAGDRFYLTNITATTSTAYYTTNPSGSWTSCSMPTTGIWTEIGAGYRSSTLYYFALGGNGKTLTSTGYCAYSTTGTGSWTNTSVSGYGIIAGAYGDMFQDDGSLSLADTSSGRFGQFATTAGRYGTFNKTSNDIEIEMENYFLPTIKYNIADYEDRHNTAYEINDISYYIEFTCAELESNPIVSIFEDSLKLYVHLKDTVIYGDFVGAQGLQIATAKSIIGNYIGTGVYGESNKNIINCPFIPKAGMIWADNQDYYKATIIKPNFELEDDKNTVQKIQISASTFKTLYVDWRQEKIDFWSEDAAANQLNTSGTLYNYIIWG